MADMERKACATSWSVSEVCDEDTNDEGRMPYASMQLSMRWIESEISARLISIDQKLDALSCQVGCCQDGICYLKGWHDGKPTIDNQRSVNEGSRSSPSREQIAEAWAAVPASSTPPGPEIAPRSNNTVVSNNSFMSNISGIISDRSQAFKPETSARCLSAGLEAHNKMMQAMKNSSSEESRSQLVLDKVRETLDDPESGISAKAYNIFVPCIVIVSSVWSLLQTMQDPPVEPVPAAIVEIIVEVIFCIDIVVRFAVSPIIASFFRNPHNIVDILCASPILVRLIVGPAFSQEDRELFPGCMLFYVVPLLRLLKTLRGFREFNLIFTTVLQVYMETWPTMLMLGWVMLLFGTLIYAVEPRHNISSYPQALWFVVVTITTVGYGDLTPTTAAGYCISAVLVSSSVFVMALPLGIIGTAVSEIWKDRDTILLRNWARQRFDQWGYQAKDIPLFFAAFDSDGNGELDFSEFCDMLREMRIDIKESRIRKLFNSFDYDDSGTVDAEEFIWHLFPASYRAVYGKEAQEAKKDAHNRLSVNLNGSARNSSSSLPRSRGSAGSLYEVDGSKKRRRAEASQGRQSATGIRTPDSQGKRNTWNSDSGVKMNSTEATHVSVISIVPSSSGNSSSGKA